MSSRVKHKNPFAMGNLDDLMYARMDDDIEYLKEWSRLAVKYHEAEGHIYHKAWEKLCDTKRQADKDVEEIRTKLRELYDNGVEV